MGKGGRGHHRGELSPERENPVTQEGPFVEAQYQTHSHLGNYGCRFSLALSCMPNPARSHSPKARVIRQVDNTRMVSSAGTT